MSADLSVALYENIGGAVRLIWRSRDPELVNEIRRHAAAEQRRLLTGLECPPLRAVPPPDSDPAV